MSQALSFDEVCKLIGLQVVQGYQREKEMQELLVQIQQRNEELMQEMQTLHNNGK